MEFHTLFSQIKKQSCSPNLFPFYKNRILHISNPYRAQEKVPVTCWDNCQFGIPQLHTPRQSVPQRKPIELHTAAPDAHLTSDFLQYIKEPLKERSNATFENHRELFQALGRQKSDLSQRRGRKVITAGPEICESLEKWWSSGIWSTGQRFFRWRAGAKGPSVWCKTTQTSMCLKERQSGVKRSWQQVRPLWTISI